MCIINIQKVAIYNIFIYFQPPPLEDSSVASKVSKANSRKQEWAHEVKMDMENFKELVPELAYEVCILRTRNNKQKTKNKVNIDLYFLIIVQI